MDDGTSGVPTWNYRTRAANHSREVAKSTAHSNATNSEMDKDGTRKVTEKQRSSPLIVSEELESMQDLTIGEEPPRTPLRILDEPAFNQVATTAKESSCSQLEGSKELTYSRDLTTSEEHLSTLPKDSEELESNQGSTIDDKQPSKPTIVTEEVPPESSNQDPETKVLCEFLSSLKPIQLIPLNAMPKIDKPKAARKTLLKPCKKRWVSVRGFDPNINSDVLSRALAKFGEILELNMKKKAGSVAASVQYKTAKMAEKAIIMGRLKIGTRHCKIMYASCSDFSIRAKGPQVQRTIVIWNSRYKNKSQ